ncbi:MAG: hypothetical protein L3J03_06815 [Desulfobacterales bacterium]|nr:hypothetical protein [Desulfobacterales bacterium]
MKKLNCWEFKKCGREPGGVKVSELGVCPASTETRVDGVNHGDKGGRACWAVSGTFCKGKIEGTFSSKASSCMLCDFYKKVCREQGSEFKGAGFILEILRKSAGPDRGS